MLDFRREPWDVPHPAARSLVARRSWQPPLASCAVTPSLPPLAPTTRPLPPPSAAGHGHSAAPVLEASLDPLPPPAGAPRHAGESASTGQLPPPSAVSSPLAPPAFPPRDRQLETFTSSPDDLVEPDDTSRHGPGPRPSVVGAVVGMLLLGVTLVGLGVLDSSDDSWLLEEMESEPVGAEPQSEPLPATTTAVAEESAPQPDAPMTVAPSPAVTEPATPPEVSDDPPPELQTADRNPAPAPLSLGTAAPVGERYVVTLTAVDLDATELIVAAAPANEPPAPGDAYVMITLDVEFIGEGEGQPYFDLLVGAVGHGLEFNDIDCLPLTPNDMFDRPPLATGEIAVGTFCLTVPLHAVDSLTFFVGEYRSITDTRVWWSATG